MTRQDEPAPTPISAGTTETMNVLREVFPVYKVEEPIVHRTLVSFRNQTTDVSVSAGADAFMIEGSLVDTQRIAALFDAAGVDPTHLEALEELRQRIAITVGGRLSRTKTIRATIQRTRDIKRPSPADLKRIYDA